MGHCKSSGEFLGGCFIWIKIIIIAAIIIMEKVIYDLLMKLLLIKIGELSLRKQ